MNLFRKPTLTLPFRRAQEGFMLVELMVGLGIIIITGASAIACMVQMNRQSVVNRLYTCAQGAVQNQIERVLTDTPFIPQQSEIPDELVVGTHTDTGVVVYEDPVTSNDSVTGTMTTTVTDTSTTLSGTDLHVVRVTVALTYTYRSKAYKVSADTMRTADL